MARRQPNAVSFNAITREGYPVPYRQGQNSNLKDKCLSPHSSEPSFASFSRGKKGIKPPPTFHLPVPPYLSSAKQSVFLQDLPNCTLSPQRVDSLIRVPSPPRPSSATSKTQPTWKPTGKFKPAVEKSPRRPSSPQRPSTATGTSRRNQPTWLGDVESRGHDRAENHDSQN